eukprot:TRINITY_DN2714_c0_g1_i2.p1 TRINITY_DN2714_c0_g1~~TRINITY_DN2714_c0_g1_i2.p1  ORF type:complete len:122 (-),score=50.56 TRINITY_DN2714_c0_g1_i2:210-575(-)
MNKPTADWNLDVEGDMKLTMTPDTKVENAMLFRMEKEDHTLGNLLRSKLMDDDNVLFVGYRVPHPLTHAVELKVHCGPETTPAQALQRSLDSVLADLEVIERQFQEQLELTRRQNDSTLFP